MLGAVRQATAGLGEATGVGPSPREIPSGTALAEALSTFSRNLAAYCRVIAANVVETDAASVERFRRAVSTLEEYRAGRRGGEDDDDTGELPVPATQNGIAPGMPGSSPFITTGPNATT